MSYRRDKAPRRANAFPNQESNTDMLTPVSGIDRDDVRTPTRTESPGLPEALFFPEPGYSPEGASTSVSLFMPELVSPQRSTRSAGPAFIARSPRSKSPQSKSRSPARERNGGRTSGDRHQSAFRVESQSPPRRSPRRREENGPSLRAAMPNGHSSPISRYAGDALSPREETGYETRLSARKKTMTALRTGAAPHARVPQHVRS